MDFLAADSLPWLGESQERIRRAAAAGRLPHSMLLLSAAGLGAENLGHWIAAFALCESAGRPCGACPSCLLLRADNHPDLNVLRVDEDARQIKVDQVRGLIESLELKSYRGGYKVGVIEGAEALNANGANAFLKTLEEPTQNTLLIMIATPSHRLPATIASRCLRIGVRTPSPEAARSWLSTHASSAAPAASWDSALMLAGGAPLLAAQLDPQRVRTLDEEMRASMERLTANSVDVTVLAEHWAKSDPALRLAWLENWITGRVYAGLGIADSVETAERTRLPAALLKPKIRGLFALLDALREFRRFASTGMNQQLALEALLLGGRAALAK